MQHQHDPAIAKLSPSANPSTLPACDAPQPMDHQMNHGSMNHGKMDHGKMGGHDHGAMIADFLRRFWVCLALSVPVVAGSMMFQNLVGHQFTFPYSTPLLLGLYN